MNGIGIGARAKAAKRRWPLFAGSLLTLVPLFVLGVTPPPGAGTILQQAQPIVPPSPASNQTGLTIAPQSAGALPPSAPFAVNALSISGNSVFDAPTLHALVADAEGKSLTLPQLQALATRLSDYYHAHGYPLARAIIPAQTIESGRVRIEIIEARYGRIDVDNGSRTSPALLRSTLSNLRPGQVIEQGSLDHSLLLLSDIPGVVVNATLKPGEAVGSSDLLVDTPSAAVLSGSAAVDNFGNRYTGRVRGGGTLDLIEPLGYGDVLSLTGLSSGSNMDYGRIAYDSLLDGEGTRAGIAYSGLHYRLGNTLAALDAHGIAEVASLWAKQPLVRSPGMNLYVQIQYDRLQLRDHIDAGDIRTDRHLDDGTISLLGDARDPLLSGALTAWTVGFTRGQVDFDDLAAQSADAGTVKSAGRFSKWTASVNRLQNLGGAYSLYFAISGQWASRNLDDSQKLVEGGVYTVRAYDMGAISADTGYQETAELRRELGSAWAGRWLALAFLDSAQLSIDRTPWVAGKNSAALSGAGIGLNWTGPHAWSAKSYVAARLGAAPADVRTSSAVRAWIEIDKAFQSF